MNNKSDFVFKIVFAVGMCLIMISFFLDWYVFEESHTSSIVNPETSNSTIPNSDQINLTITTWSFNIFTGWVCSDINNPTIPSLLSPDLFFISIYVFSYIIAVASFIYICLNYSKVHKESYFEKTRSLGYILMIFVVFNLYNQIQFFYNLIQNSLYFPFVKFENFVNNSAFIYSLGIGCYLHFISFIFIFPFSLFIFIIPYKFKTEEQKIDINEYIEEKARKVNLDKVIQKAMLKSDKKFDYKVKDKSKKPVSVIDKIKLEGV